MGKRLFISYARVDKPLVIPLVEILQQGAYEPWFDRNLLPGEDWKITLHQQIETCDAFLYMLTPESVASEWCQWEFSEAIQMDKPILPILLQLIEELPATLTEHQYADFTNGITPGEVARLMAGLSVITTSPKDSGMKNTPRKGSLEKSQPVRLLLVDDEPVSRVFLRIELERAGYQALEASSGLEAIEAVHAQPPDLILLDVMMPELNGWDTLDMLRKFTDVPVIICTAKETAPDVVFGLELGADDYVKKPYDTKELLGRIKAVLRRVGKSNNTNRIDSNSILIIDDRLKVDFSRREVIVEGNKFRLRPTESRLLQLLINNAGQGISQDELLEKVWGDQYQNETHYVRLYVKYLREKIEVDPTQPRYIESVGGTGYRFMDYEVRQ